MIKTPAAQLVLTTTMAIMGTMLFVPPWVQGPIPSGYSLVFESPKYATGIDWPRLLAQEFGVALLGAAIVFSLNLRPGR